jgi:hypothetical protein
MKSSECGLSPLELRFGLRHLFKKALEVTLTSFAAPAIPLIKYVIMRD